jgi:glycine betaine/proline transport system permease protein
MRDDVSGVGGGPGFPPDLVRGPSGLRIRLERAPPAAASSVLWLAAFAVSLSFLFIDISGWLLEVPRAWRIPAQRWISAAMQWLVEDASFGLFTFRELTRFVAAILDVPLAAATSLFATGLLSGQGSAAVEILPPLPWIAVLAGAALIAWHAGGAGLAAFAAAAFLYLAAFGQWQSAMMTLSSIAIAVPFGVAGGVLLGIAGFRSARFRRIMTPVLDGMQTIPVFAYLLPILFLFGFGPVSALVATIIYAMPPMVRVTMLALDGVPAETVEFGRMAGCTRRQLVWRVMVPVARAPLMVGVNQVIMLSLNMVIIASMIGAGGLGFDVLAALRRLDIGAGIEAGLAIVVLAVALDRISQAYAVRAARGGEASSARSARLALPLAALGAMLALWLAGFAVPAIRTYPAAWQVSTASYWDGLVEWLNVNLFDTFEAIKTAVLLNVLVPVKRFMLAQPWPWVVAVVTAAMWQLAGLRRAVVAGAFLLFIAFTGNWEPAMVTVYLVGVSVVIAALIGIPIGIAAGLNKRLWGIVQAVIDTLQTLPSFVYLIPVVMLFRVGDFTAMIAVILYALAPAVRYTALGVREVNPSLIEAATAMGTTRRQRLMKVRLPLALPEIMLGVNQTIMLAISMLVITALVGTRDLGQEVYIALAKADVGRGLVAGLGVAMIAMIADRMMTASATRMKRRLGLG